MAELLLLGANSRSTAAHGTNVGTWMMAGISYPALSMLNARWYSGARPWPPYSLGKHRPAKPASNS